MVFGERSSRVGLVIGLRGEVDESGGLGLGDILSCCVGTVFGERLVFQMLVFH